MVQKYQSPVRVYKYPFELVMAAYEKRFPSCEMIPVFVGSDVISEETSEDGAIHIIERRCSLNVDAPYLLKKIAGVDFVYFVQRNTLDRRARTLKIEAWNESFASRIIIQEYCTYSVHPEDPNLTCFEQSASLEVKSFFGFENAVEKLAAKQYAQNIKKGKEIIEFYIEELRSQGITHVPPFVSGKSTPLIKVNQSEAGSEISDASSGVVVSNETTDATANKTNNLAPASLSSEANFPSRDVNLKLESEYIARCVGKLTPLQESSLVQLKKWMADAHQGKVPTDQTMMRFLQAQDFNLEKAREMLCQSLVWRKKYQVDRILNTYDVPKVVKELFPGGWHHYDKDGRPLYILRLGQMDVKGFIKSIGQEGLVKLTLHVCEEGLKKAEEATQKTGKPISSWSLLVDLEELSMRHLWRPGIRASLHIIEMVEANYPETLGRVLFTRAPRVFPILWTLVSAFINENTRSKFVFYTGNDYQGDDGLEEFISAEYIPDFLGGKCTTSSIPEGGVVPKSYYMSEEEYLREKSEGKKILIDDSMYQSVSLQKGQVHEILFDIKEKGSVITWDFDVIKQDVTFTVLRLDRLLPTVEESDEHESAQGCGGGHSALPQLGRLSLDGTAGPIVIPKTWIINQDYHAVEPCLEIKEGESVQGSHITRTEGTYVLQWKHVDQQHHSFDFSSHKAKIMFFYEVLKSQDYKGSMSSLQSSHSGTTLASGQSANGSCPSR